MPSFILTNLAKSDLKEIGHYTQARWGREQRLLYLNMLDLCFRQLSANPFKGRECSDIRNGYRKLNAGCHIIFYRMQSDDVIEIVRILHSRMDVETHLSEQWN